MRAPSTKKAAAKESLAITTKCQALFALHAVVAALTLVQAVVLALAVAAVKAVMATAKCQKASIR